MNHEHKVIIQGIIKSLEKQKSQLEEQLLQVYSLRVEANEKINSVGIFKISGVERVALTSFHYYKQVIFDLKIAIELIAKNIKELSTMEKTL